MKEGNWFYKKYIKRVIDIVLSAIGIIVTSPILAITSLLILKKIGKPVCFNQMRAGLDGKPFKMYKFRSMTNETDEKGNLLPNEERITPFGSIIRKLTIDELPQFVNILKGNMSIIGPRPLPVIYTEHYDDFQRRRLEVKPGIVGLASVSGRNNQSWDDKFKCDVEYVDTCSFQVDFKLFLKAIFVTLKHEEVNAEGYVSGEPFIKQ